MATTKSEKAFLKKLGTLDLAGMREQYRLVAEQQKESRDDVHGWIIYSRMLALIEAATVFRFHGASARCESKPLPTAPEH